MKLALPHCGLSRRLRSTLTIALAAVLMIGAAGAAGATITGIDGASYQHPNGASVDWNQVHNSGQSFAFIKATEGNSGGYVNPYFASDANGVKAAGMYLGTYHYARPEVNVWGDRYASAENQARFYIGTIGGYANAGNLPPALDYEDTGTGLGAGDLVNWAQRWLDTVQQLTGRTPIVYAANWYWSQYLGSTTQFARYPLWIANYTTAAAPAMFGGWTSWAFWQYTSSGIIPGIQARVDLNRFYSDAGALARLAGGAGPTIVDPNSADLQVTVAAPINVAPGQGFAATVTVTNHGPASAASTTASLLPLGAFQITNRGGGTAVGDGTDFTTPLLAAGQSRTYTVSMTANGPLGALIAFAFPRSPDPDVFNNFGLAPVLAF